MAHHHIACMCIASKDAQNPLSGTLQTNRCLKRISSSTFPLNWSNPMMSYHPKMMSYHPKMMSYHPKMISYRPKVMSYRPK